MLFVESKIMTARKLKLPALQEKLPHNSNPILMKLKKQFDIQDVMKSKSISKNNTLMKRDPKGQDFLTK